eukprot:CAMPEP_0194444614 /NCGR_PEP_ID=MMETSP0176-20130528/127379_1 /TAXON_ID=216777 /ORGANISM="Proboscia alata, Strain PI-D3" /LENGTH=805 /DNA_ID=CAMNT_0039271037 /DNA_START=151 /DNA_END=2569 /DNA_ORIENTATION=-
MVPLSKGSLQQLVIATYLVTLNSSSLRLECLAFVPASNCIRMPSVANDCSWTSRLQRFTNSQYLEHLEARTYRKEHYPTTSRHGRFTGIHNAALFSTTESTPQSIPVLGEPNDPSSQTNNAPANDYVTTDAILSASQTVLSNIQTSIQTSQTWAESYLYDDQYIEASNFHALFSGLRQTSGLTGLGGTPIHLPRSTLVSSSSTTLNFADCFTFFSLQAALINDFLDPPVAQQTPASRSTLVSSSSTTLNFADCFTFFSLQAALINDFLDASRGSTNPRVGWTVATVSEPRGTAFHEARMTITEIRTALTSGTVIFNALGAHVPQLASASLAACDATDLPCACNLYVTAANMRTSAPPHTDRQDVCVVQSQGRKRWRVYSPPRDQKRKPMADVFARGKMEDHLSVYDLEERYGCELLLDTVLEAGDVLFVPAGFPHTTSTDSGTSGSSGTATTTSRNNDEDTSIHLTFNFDTHVWELDYVSLRMMAYIRANVYDVMLDSPGADNKYTGLVNTELSQNVRTRLLDALPFDFLSLDNDTSEKMVQHVTQTVMELSHEIHPESASLIPPEIWEESTRRLLQYGNDILEIHRDMYLIAIEEGQYRHSEPTIFAGMEDTDVTETDPGAYLERYETSIVKSMTQARIQRMSLFRVPMFYDKVDETKLILQSNWGPAPGMEDNSDGGGGGGAETQALPADWKTSWPLNIGDEVEADLGGAFFEARVTRIQNDQNTYDVQFFDGDDMDGLSRDMILLKKIPVLEVASTSGGGGTASGDDLGGIDTTGMTKKEIKRLMKKNKKKQTKNKEAGKGF